MTIHTCNFRCCKPQTEGQEVELSEFKPLQDIQREVVSKIEEKQGREEGREKKKKRKLFKCYYLLKALVSKLS